jgi:hypothetical protein
MMNEGKYFLDSHGFPRADFDEPTHVLGWYLEQDIQNSSSSCDEMLSICDSAALDPSMSWSGSGNAHTITVKGTRVIIENEFADPPVSCELSTGQFRAALEAWKRLISSL